MNSSIETHLCLAHSKITDQEIGPLIKGLPNLKSLDISNCTQLTARGIQTIALNLWDKQLVSLKVAHCKNSKIQPEDWIQFIQLIDLTKIEVLDLSNIACEFASEKPVKNFADVRPFILLMAKCKRRITSAPLICKY